MTIKIRELPPVLQAVFNLSVIDRYPQIAIAKMNGIRLEAAETFLPSFRNGLGYFRNKKISRALFFLYVFGNQPITCWHQIGLTNSIFK
jgi:hypothetical protein